MAPHPPRQLNAVAVTQAVHHCGDLGDVKAPRPDTMPPPPPPGRVSDHLLTSQRIRSRPVLDKLAHRYDPAPGRRRARSTQATHRPATTPSKARSSTQRRTAPGAPSPSGSRRALEAVACCSCIECTAANGVARERTRASANRLREPRAARCQQRFRDLGGHFSANVWRLNHPTNAIANAPTGTTHRCNPSMTPTGRHRSLPHPSPSNQTSSQPATNHRGSTPKPTTPRDAPCRDWSGGIFVFVDEVIAAGRSDESRGQRAEMACQPFFAAFSPALSIEASSGRTVRHRLNRGGNRQLSRAIHLAAIAQIRRPSTEGHAYYQRCLDRGKTNREAIRALKRRISDRVWTHLQADLQHTKPDPCLT